MNMKSLTQSLLSLWLWLQLGSTVLAQDPSVVAFGGADHTTYTDWLQSVNYARFIFLPGSSSSDGAAIHWSIVDDQIYLAVAVRATGWAGFGISENGGMRGADMVIFQASGDEIIDAHVLEALYPIPDACQSWSSHNSVVDGGFLIFEATRLLDTGDAQDRALFDDSSLLTPANRIVAAWGDTPSYSYHGSNRARGSIRFFGNDIGDAWESFAKTMAAESEGSFALIANDFAVPTWTTTYKHFCFSESDLIAMGMPADTPLHGIGIEPIVDERTASFVHHFIVYGSENPTSCAGSEIAFTWAPGDLPVALPSNLGSPLGTDGYRSFRIQVHYNNPSATSGLLDSSGIKVFWTSQKREFDMGVLQLGDPLLDLTGQLVGNGLTSHEFQCGASCSGSLLPQPITVIREQLHMHISGRRMFNQQIRDGEALRVATVDYFDYEQQGTLSVVQDAYIVEPGDAFQTKCYYNSQNERFGLASDDEMCIAFLYYYPKVELPLPFACGVNYLFGSFSQCDAEWTTQSLGRVDDLERNFGGVPLSCPAAPSIAPIAGDIFQPPPSTAPVAPAAMPAAPTTTTPGAPYSTPDAFTVLPTFSGSTNATLKSIVAALVLHVACSLFM